VAVVLVAFGLGVGSDSGGEHADWTELCSAAARWLCWLGAGPLVLGVAGPRAPNDRRDGIEALAAMRGHAPRDLGRARVVAAIVEIALRLAVPSAVLCVAFAALAWRSGPALLMQAVALGAFAALAGLVLGGLGALCSELGAGRGRALLLGVLLVPWAVGDVAGHPEWSIPGALGRVLVTLAHVGAYHGGGA
jgi:hypothetical protein